MGLTYIGNCDFEEIQEPDFDVDLYGLDTMTRTFEGRSDRADRFLLDYTQGKPDPEYKFFSFANYSRSGSQGVTKLGLNFVGKAEPNLARSHTEVDTRIQTVSLTGENTGRTANITYKSPMIRTMFAVEERPTDDTEFQAQPEDNIEVLYITGIPLLRGTPLGDGFDRLFAAEFNVGKVAHRTSFPRVQAGKWWRCTETIELLLIQGLNTGRV